MTKKITILFSIIILAGILLLPALTLAQQTCPYSTLEECQKWALNKVGDKIGYGSAGAVTSADLSYTIGQVVSYVLAFLGVAFLVIVVYSGIQWMTAGGNAEAVKKARDRLVNAAIGLVIVLGAYAITWFVVSKLQTSVSPPTSTPPYTPPTASCLDYTNCAGEFKTWCDGQSGITQCPQDPNEPNYHKCYCDLST
ncbi:pilin [Patescibacteria group bacterium]|nr:pilin [Patescibacteria group bacterium]